MLVAIIFYLGCDLIDLPTVPARLEDWQHSDAPMLIETIYWFHDIEDNPFRASFQASVEKLPELVKHPSVRVRAIANMAYLHLLPEDQWLSVLQDGFSDEGTLDFVMDCYRQQATLGDVLLWFVLSGRSHLVDQAALLLLDVPDDFPIRTEILRDLLSESFILNNQDRLRQAARQGDLAVLAPLATLGNPADQALILNGLIRLRREPFIRDQAISVLRACTSLPAPEQLPHLFELYELTRHTQLTGDLDHEFYRALAQHREPVVQTFFTELASDRRSGYLQGRLRKAIPENALSYFEETLWTLLRDVETTPAMTRYLVTRDPERVRAALDDWRRRNPHSLLTLDIMIRDEDTTFLSTETYPRLGSLDDRYRVFNRGVAKRN